MRYLRYEAVLRRPLEADGTTLPVSRDDHDRLALLLPPGETALLVLRDDLHREEVEVAVQGGYPVLVRRGIDGPAHKFPKGSAIGFEVTVAMVKHLICHHECCPEGPCPVEPPAVAGTSLPTAADGVPWEGTVIFTGGLPMQFGTGPLPAWVSVDAGPNHVRLHGTPPDGGWDMPVTVAAANGSGVATGSWTVHIDGH
jgi:hypothetical protein